MTVVWCIFIPQDFPSWAIIAGQWETLPLLITPQKSCHQKSKTGPGTWPGKQLHNHFQNSLVTKEKRLKDNAVEWNESSGSFGAFSFQNDFLVKRS